ncbi:transposase [Muricoccus radiodurans]|uniref:transposase n=1 Tax=Muricoccus radiodurans TaxID=2231721 RepID=UPI003CEB0125
MPLPPTHPSRPTHTPLTDDAWLALLPHILPRSPQGRRVADLRRRMDGILWLGMSRGAPWKDLPERFGKPDTVARFFRRLTHAGLWHRLLHEISEAGPRHPLKGIAPMILRATRRAARLGGMRLLLLIRQLDLREALNGPPWLLPDPLLSEMLRRAPLPRPPRDKAEQLAALTHLKTLKALLKTAAGRARLSRAMRLAWI